MAARIEYSKVADVPSGFFGPGGRWPHVDPARELASKDDGSILIVPGTLDRFEQLRRRMGRPLGINSFYRTPAHNLAVASTGEHGPHTTGQAIDIRIYGFDWIRLVAIAYELGFTGFGINQAEKVPVNERFIHLDDLDSDPAVGRVRPATWWY